MERKTLEAGNKVADLWEYLEMVRQAADNLSPTNTQIEQQRVFTAGQIEAVYKQCEEMGDLAGLSKKHQMDWVETIMEASRGVMGQYANYLRTIKNRQEIEELLMQLEEDPSELSAFLQKGLDQFPLIYLTAAQINYQGKELAARPALGWYKESLVLAAAVAQKIDAFVDRLKDRSARLKQQNGREPEVLNFLEDLRGCLQLLIMDCVNIANGFYIHILEEDCAVLLSQAEFNLRDPAEHAAVLQRILQLEKYPVFGGSFGARFFPAMKAESRKRQGEGMVPCFLSVVDVREFLKFFDRYWTSLLDGLKDKGPHDNEIADWGASTYIKLKGAAKIQCRPQPLVDPNSGRQFKQARIAILGEGNFAGFDIRVDMNGRGDLELDLGGVTVEEALAYAQEKGLASQTEDVIMKYSAIVGEGGQLFASRKQKKEYYPSVMRSQAQLPDGSTLNWGAKAALFASVVMKQGIQIGSRLGRVFSYHYKTPEINQHRGNFAQIAEQLKKALI